MLHQSKVEFWRYSSRNRAKHAPHPRTAILRESILIHWNAGWTEEAIAARHSIDLDTVGRHLKEARKARDPRAAVRHAATLKAMAGAS